MPRCLRAGAWSHRTDSPGIHRSWCSSGSSRRASRASWVKTVQAGWVGARHPRAGGRAPSTSRRWVWACWPGTGVGFEERGGPGCRCGRRPRRTRRRDVAAGAVVAGLGSIALFGLCVWGVGRGRRVTVRDGDGRVGHGGLEQTAAWLGEGGRRLGLARCLRSRAGPQLAGRGLGARWRPRHLRRGGQLAGGLVVSGLVDCGLGRA